MTEKKLQEDNVKLFAECIRLKKVCLAQEKELQSIKLEIGERLRQSEEENRQLWGEVE